MRPLLRFLLAFLAFSYAAATAASAQESGLSFLTIGTNAAAGGMGDAQVAFSRDAFSTYWNPAGLAGARTNSIGLSYHSWIADVRTYGAAARFRLGERGGVGLFATAMGSGDLEERSGPGEPDGFFEVQFVSTGASYGRKFGLIRAGITGKFLTERIFSQSANGYAFDFGLQADAWGERLFFGAAFQNLGRMSKLEAEATTLPEMFRIGAAGFPLNVLLADDASSLLDILLSAELVHVFPGSITQLHLGTSVEILDVIELRAGYITNDDLRSITLGTGFGYERLTFDYAFQHFESGFDGPGHIVTLGYHW